MLAIDVKRGVAATLERVFNATGNKFDELSIAWSGKTAGIKREGRKTTVIFPNIDETQPVSKTLFNELIGYALHELGHAWFTTDKPWDNARTNHGAYVSMLINGLEDPRIEQCVINSGYAPNSRALFEFLTNQVLRKGGYVEPDDFKNIPFMLAIEGRRLNGYSICFESVVDASPYAPDLRWALTEANKATSTERIVAIAIKLYERLKQRRDKLEQQKPEQQKNQPDSQPDSQPDGQPEQGEDGGETPQNGSGDADQDGEGEDKGKPGDQPSEKPGDGQGGSHGEPTGRDPEPTEFINDELRSIQSDADERRSRPHVGKPIYLEFNFR
jgi:hypothetical protein